MLLFTLCCIERGLKQKPDGINISKQVRFFSLKFTCSLLKKLWCLSWFSDLQICRCRSNFKITVTIPVSDEGTLTLFDLVLKGKDLETETDWPLAFRLASLWVPPSLLSFVLLTSSVSAKGSVSIGSFHLLISYLLMNQSFIVIFPFSIIYPSCRNPSD